MITIHYKSVNALDANLAGDGIRTFIGLVYITRCFLFKDCAIAYSATTVFPALVCADTSTLSLR